MRSAIAVLFLAMALGSSAAAAGQAKGEDEAAVRKVVSNFAESWNHPGMPGFGDLFANDADFVVITGKWLKGRNEIVSYHKNLLETYYKGSHLTPEEITVRFVRPEVAIVHARWSASYTEDGKEQKRTALMTITFTKQGTKWLIAAVHNTLTGGPGAMED